VITVHKFPIQRTFKQVIKIHGGLETTDPFKIMRQDGEIFLWKIVDTECPLLELEVLTFGTGQEIPYNTYLEYCHIESIIDGQYVWHFFGKILESGDCE